MSYFDTVWYVKDNGTVGWSAVTPWSAGATIAAGTFVRQLAFVAGNERCFVALTAGTTGGTEPTWIVTRGAKTTDNTVTWQECTGAAGPNGDLINCPSWVASRAVSIGEVYQDPVSASLQICSTVGTSKTGAAPTFSATAGVTTTDNTVTWTSLGPESNYTTTPWLYPHARIQNALAGGSWAAAGNTAFVSNNHAETLAASLSIISIGTYALPNKIYCANDSVAPPTAQATTASVSATGASTITLPGGNSNYFYGINFNAGSAALAGSISILSGNNTSTFDTCTFKLNTTAAGSKINWGGTAFNLLNAACSTFINSNFVFGATGQGFAVLSGVGGFGAKFVNCAFGKTGIAPSTLLQVGVQTISQFFFIDCDFSGITGTVLTGAVVGQCEMQNCDFGAGATVSPSATAGLSYFRLSNCDSANTNYSYQYTTASGSVLQETTIVRTGSLATNGTTPLSWNMTCNANGNFSNPLISDEISQWNSAAGSPLTAIIYLTSNASLGNSKLWVEFEYPASASNPLGTRMTTKASLIGAPTTLTADTSTWGGSTTNKYSISVTFTPQQVGPVKCRVYSSVASAVYVDPWIYGL